jgi:hypothetical protein
MYPSLKGLRLGSIWKVEFMIDNADIGRDIDLLTDQERPLHDNSLTTVAKMCLIESIDECKTGGPLHLSRSIILFILG